MKGIIIPDGQQNAYYRQFGKLNRIEPIQLKSGDWFLPDRVIKMLKEMYAELDEKKQKERKDVTKTIIDFAKDTIKDLKKFKIEDVEKKDIHERYFEKDAKIQQDISR